jgi:Na+(H+)/acetate symporter ActP
MKKINITSAVLLVYLLVMSVIGWRNMPAIGWVQYCLVIGLTLGAIFLLRFVQIKRFRSREKIKKEREKSEN